MIVSYFTIFLSSMVGLGLGLVTSLRSHHLPPAVGVALPLLLLVILFSSSVPPISHVTAIMAEVGVQPVAAAVERGEQESEVPLAALPSPADVSSSRVMSVAKRRLEEEERTAATATTVVVGGNPVSLNKMGPIVVNSDGTLSGITNWNEMTSAEQQATLRIIGKRNRKRLATLRAAGVEIPEAAAAAAHEPQEL